MARAGTAVQTMAAPSTVYHHKSADSLRLCGRTHNEPLCDLLMVGSQGISRESVRKSAEQPI